MTEPKPPTDKELAAPINAEGDENYQVLANECGRRVYNVMKQLIDVRGTNYADGLLMQTEVSAIMMGAITGIAFHVANWQMEVADPDAGDTPVEVLLLNDLGNQFLHVIKQRREQTAVPPDATVN